MCRDRKIDMTFMTTENSSRTDSFDLICFSHLRWDFVFQRPQHLLTRFAKDRRVFFIEEPVFGDDGPRLEISKRDNGLHIVLPHLPHGSNVDAIMPDLITGLSDEQQFGETLAWFYTPMMLRWADGLEPD